jgi:hypothetical protein
MIEKTTKKKDAEWQAMGRIASILAELSPNARQRIVDWVSARQLEKPEA